MSTPEFTSEATRKLQQHIADMQERLTAEIEHDKVRLELRQFVEARPALTQRDLLDLAKAMRRKHDDEAVMSSKAHTASRAKKHNKRRQTPELIKLGETIMAARTKAGLSSSKLADKLKCSHASVTSWERGYWAPSPDKVAKLHQLLGTPKTLNGDAR